MQITVTARETELTPSLRDYAQKKAAKLEEFFKNIQKVEVILDAKSTANADKRQVVEVRVWLAGLHMVQATAGERDMYAAIDVSLEEAKHQIEKVKEKMTKEQRREGSKLKQLSREQNFSAGETP
jgi:putative sigma-54 modulation protein